MRFGDIQYNFKFATFILYIITLNLQYQPQFFQIISSYLSPSSYCIAQSMKNEELNLSVISCGSIDRNWQKKPKKPIISKIIQRDAGDFAIILNQDHSKPLRFLYLTLLLSKNRFEYLRGIIGKMQRLQESKIKYLFEEKSREMMEITDDVTELIRNLRILQTKMEKNKEDQLLVAKLAEEHLTVDPLLVLSLRLIAHTEQFKIQKALNCSIPITFTHIYQMLRKFGVQKDQKNQLNRFVIFYNLKQIQIQYFKLQGVGCEKQKENCQQLFDEYLINYQEYIILEMLYTDL